MKNFLNKIKEGVQVADQQRWQSAMMSSIGDIGSERVNVSYRGKPQSKWLQCAGMPSRWQKPLSVTDRRIQRMEYPGFPTISPVILSYCRRILQLPLCWVPKPKLTSPSCSCNGQTCHINESWDEIFPCNILYNCIATKNRTIFWQF